MIFQLTDSRSSTQLSAFIISLKLPKSKEVERGSECLPGDGPIEAVDSNPRPAEPDETPLMIAEKMKQR